MIAEVKSAVATKDPLIMMFWQPHWLFAEEEFNWVSWDDADGECVEEAGQTRGDACGFQQASIDKIANVSFKENYPGAFALYEAIEIDNDTQNALMLEIDQKGRDLEEVIAATASCPSSGSTPTRRPGPRGSRLAWRPSSKRLTQDRPWRRPLPWTPSQPERSAR